MMVILFVSIGGVAQTPPSLTSDQQVAITALFDKVVADFQLFKNTTLTKEQRASLNTQLLADEVALDKYQDFITTTYPGYTYNWRTKALVPIPPKPTPKPTPKT